MSVELKRVLVELRGCDQSTEFSMHVTPEELVFLARIAARSEEFSTYECEPVMIVKKESEGE